MGIINNIMNGIKKGGDDLSQEIEKKSTENPLIVPLKGDINIPDAVTDIAYSYFTKLSLYFVLLVMKFFNELLFKIVPDPEELKNASMDTIKKKVFETGSAYQVLVKLLQDQEFIDKWNQVFEEFYEKLVEPFLEKGFLIAQEQSDVFLKDFERIIYTATRNSINGVVDGLYGALEILPLAGTIIEVASILQLIINLMSKFIKALQGPLTFMIEMLNEVGSAGKPLVDILNTINDIYNKIRETYNELQETTQNLNIQSVVESQKKIDEEEANIGNPKTTTPQEEAKPKSKPLPPIPQPQEETTPKTTPLPPIPQEETTSPQEETTTPQEQKGGNKSNIKKTKSHKTKSHKNNTIKKHTRKQKKYDKKHNKNTKKHRRNKKRKTHRNKRHNSKNKFKNHTRKTKY